VLRWGLTCALVILALALQCCGAGGRGPKPVLSERERALLATMILRPASEPEDGAARALAELGRGLFFDAGLSRNGEVSCATCHRPELDFTDGLRVAEGLMQGRRNVPSVLGAHAAPFLGWGGRADSLWSQALGPLEDAAEMGGDRTAIARRVGARYATAFESLFGPLPELGDPARFPARARPVPEDPRSPEARAWHAMAAEDRDAIDRAFANVGRALAAYESTLRHLPSAFDRWAEGAVRGRDAPTEEFPLAAREGLRVFLGAGGCINCHNGPYLSDFAFHNLGLPERDPDSPDPGHAEDAKRMMLSPWRGDRRHAVNDPSEALRYFRFESAEALGAFRTPSLRNVARTAPYGHAGQFADLGEALEFYTRGDVVPAVGTRDGAVVRLERRHAGDLEAFLNTLTRSGPEAGGGDKRTGHAEESRR
jgi:cytochrome c peroxidase